MTITMKRNGKQYLLKHYTSCNEPDKHCGEFDTVLECGEAAIEHHKQSKWAAVKLTAFNGDFDTIAVFYACVGEEGCSTSIDGDSLFYPDWYEHYVVIDLQQWGLKYGKHHPLDKTEER